MSDMICGHERDVLIWALEVRAKTNAGGVLVYSAGTGRKKSRRIDAYFDVDDAAKLAEMLAERGRELGFVSFVNPSHTGRTYPNVTIWTPHLTDRFTIMFFSDGGFVSGSVSLDIAGIRRVILQWLQLTDGAREEAERVLRGATCDGRKGADNV